MAQQTRCAAVSDQSGVVVRPATGADAPAIGRLLDGFNREFGEPSHRIDLATSADDHQPLPSTRASA